IHAEETFDAATRRQAMSHDIEITDFMAQSNHFRHTHDCEMLGSTRRENAGSLVGQRRIASDGGQNFRWHERRTGARVQNGMNSSGTLEADQLNGDDPQLRSWAHDLEGGGKSGGKRGSGKDPIKPT